MSIKIKRISGRYPCGVFEGFYQKIFNTNNIGVIGPTWSNVGHSFVDVQNVRLTHLDQILQNNKQHLRWLLL